MSQAELGRSIGLSRERVSQLENGRVPWPGPELFNAIYGAEGRQERAISVIHDLDRGIRFIRSR